MQILKVKDTIQFMSLKKPALVFSLILILGSFAAIFTRGMNWGLDFTGGTLVEIGFTQDANLDNVRGTLGGIGFEDAVVQHFGSNRDVLIRIPPQEQAASIKAEMLGNSIVEALEKANAEETVTIRRIEFVGPSVGDELKEQGGLAMITALICILMYVAFRFEWRFALGAVMALVHDVMITLGLFAVTGIEFDLTVLAAILAVIGYSLNDTIVVSDRIRENFRKIRKGSPEEVTNISLTQTLARTLITSITTLLVLIALFFFGGKLIHGFATALLLGVFVGTYSSVYIASSIALTLGISKEDLMPEIVEKEGADQEPVM